MIEQEEKDHQDEKIEQINLKMIEFEHKMDYMSQNIIAKLEEVRIAQQKKDTAEEEKKKCDNDDVNSFVTDEEFKDLRDSELESQEK